MGNPSVAQAVAALTGAGIRAERGYPGTMMPQLTGAVAAVNIRQAEPLKLTLAAEVCAPMSMGASACEELAAKVAAAWTSAGAVCSYGDCDFDGQSAIYFVEVLGVWEEASEETA